ncbi:hypothetical protein GCM10010873_17000 [Cypionkella aquatica]|uniref:Uncharacterized protein n=1 Tax=Cypionkella aquatica TaxID=1756042 RepID=A0AA37U740_9RHOB|nr:hypothetical protein GCM10010873_01280 [Cypionkella aquatica]GLS86726.1 hypothetical protein GCM10010873_17000 [Cypionkella aquatica]
MSKLRWIRSLCIPTECPAQIVIAEKNTNTARPCKDGAKTTASTPSIAWALNQSDFTGSQTIRPSTADADATASTLSVEISASPNPLLPFAEIPYRKL